MKKYIALYIMFTCLYVFLHHAKEYLVLEAYTTPRKGQFYYFTGFNFFNEKKNQDQFNHYEITPLLTYGITDRFMGSFHFHISQFNPNEENNLSKPSIFLEAFTFGVQYRLTEPTEKYFDLAWSISYEYPNNDSRKKIEGKDLFTNTFIISKELTGDMNITFNFSYHQEIFYGGESKFSYGAGFKFPPFKKLDFLEMGVEITGDLSENPNIHIIPGIYISPTQNSLFKIGPGFGVTADATRFSLNIVFGVSF